MPYTDDFWNLYIGNKNDYESLCWKGKCSVCKGGLKLIYSIKRGDNEKLFIEIGLKK